VEVRESAETVSFDTGAIQVRVVRSPFRVVFLNAAGDIIEQDQPGYPVSYDGSQFRVWKSMPGGEHYFGLGDKTGPLRPTMSRFKFPRPMVLTGRGSSRCS